MRKWGLIALVCCLAAGFVAFLAWRALGPKPAEPACVWCKLPAPQGPLPAVGRVPGGEQVDGEWVPAEFAKTGQGAPGDEPGLLLRSDLLSRKGRVQTPYSYQWVAQGVRSEHGGANWLLFRNRVKGTEDKDRTAVLLDDAERPLVGVWKRAAGADPAEPGETLELADAGQLTATPGPRRGVWVRLGDDVLLRWITTGAQQTLHVAADGTALSEGESRWERAPAR